MDRKGSRTNRTNPSRRKKRYYHGKTRTSSSNASPKKLRKSDSDDDIPISHTNYCFMDFAMVFTAISNFVICRKCNGDIKFRKDEENGLGFKIFLDCKCGQNVIHSSPYNNKFYEVNRRMIFAFRLLGIGLNGLNLFCGIMDLSRGLSNGLYHRGMKHIYEASKEVYHKVTRKAVKEEQELLEGDEKQELTVSGNGTWKKRGFSSCFGVSTLIGKLTGKVFDAVVKSSFCQVCHLNKNKFDTQKELDDWMEEHKEECALYHSGSAGKMEEDSIIEMFKRSEEKYKVKYTTYIGDGDSKTFPGIIKAMPYGPEIEIVKKECLLHAEKRMGRRLLVAKKEGKNLGGNGAGKLTAKVLKNLQLYYGLALRRNSDSLVKMKNAIWATFYHNSSTDKNPQHHLCPPGPESWCKWRVAEANGTLAIFEHNPPLTDEVLAAIKPVYEEMSKDELLERCLGASTQNNNESLNSLIWTFSPKHIHSAKTAVEISTHLAVCIFNEGFQAILQIMNQMGIVIGEKTSSYAFHRDEDGIQFSNRRVSDVAKMARKARTSGQSNKDEFYEEEEGVLYGAGIAD